MSEYCVKKIGYLDLELELNAFSKQGYVIEEIFHKVVLIQNISQDYFIVIASKIEPIKPTPLGEEVGEEELKIELGTTSIYKNISYSLENYIGFDNVKLLAQKLLETYKIVRR